MTFEAAIKSYLAHVMPAKRPLTKCGKESLWVACSILWEVLSAAIMTQLIAEYHDVRLAEEDRMKDGQQWHRAANTVRLEMA